MSRISFRRKEAGFMVVEAAVAGLVVAVSVAGLVVSVCYGRQLERTTATTWRATSAATAALEEIRADSMEQWSSIPSTWNAASCAASGFVDPISSKLVAAVGQNSAALDSSQGMWNAGATAPNFYFVQVTPAGTSGDIANSLVFQTYVANRSGMTSAADTASLSDFSGLITSTTTTSTTSSAAKLSTTGSTVTLSGTGSTTEKVKVANTSALNALLTTLKVTASNTVKITYVSANGIVLFNNPASTSSAVSLSCLLKMPTGLPPGDVELVIHSSGTSFAGKTTSYGFTFLDKSTKTVSVTP